MTTREEIEYLEFMRSDIDKALHELQRIEYAKEQADIAHEEERLG
jgi:hypothetical protein